MREYHRSREQAAHGAEGDDEASNLHRMRAMQLSHNRRQVDPETKALAGQFKESMKRKIDAVEHTVTQAAGLFYSTMLREHLSDHDMGGMGALVAESVLKQLFSDLKSELTKELVGGGAIGKVVKSALNAVEKAAKQGHGNRGEYGLIQDIVSSSQHAARHFATVAKAEIDRMPDRAAADDMRMLSATLGAPGVEAESAADGGEMGSVRHGVEQQFLEAAGAPLTGALEAESLAVGMVRAYKAGRIEFAGNPEERSEAVGEALADKGPREVEKSAAEVGLDTEARTERNERDRASNVAGGAGES